MTHKLKVSRGITFEGIGSTAGVSTILLAIVLLNEGQTIAGWTLLVLGIVIALRVKSSEFDFEKQRYRFVHHFLFVKFGKWMPLAEVNRITLDSEKSTTGAIINLVQFRITTKTYDVGLQLDGQKTSLVKDFNNYKSALEFAEELSQKAELPIDNRHLKRRDKALKRRRSREGF